MLHKEPDWNSGLTPIKVVQPSAFYFDVGTHFTSAVGKTVYYSQRGFFCIILLFPHTDIGSPVKQVPSARVALSGERASRQ